jgi:lysozyme
MFKKILFAASAMMAVASASHHHFAEEENQIEVFQANWNIAGTKALVKEFEGLYLKAYTCPAGVWTIGWGHTKGVKSGMTITKAQAETYLTNDLQVFADCVTKTIQKPLNQNQRGALVSFSFNVGCGALQSSTLARRLNAGENPNTVAKQELPKWVNGGGRKLPGLVRRREAEIKFFTS